MVVARHTYELEEANTVTPYVHLGVIQYTLFKEFICLYIVFVFFPFSLNVFLNLLTATYVTPAGKEYRRGGTATHLNFKEIPNEAQTQVNII